MSKLRYILQLCSKVSVSDAETKDQMIKLAQKARNKLLRILDKSRIRDKRSIQSMLERYSFLIYPFYIAIKNTDSRHCSLVLLLGNN